LEWLYKISLDESEQVCTEKINAFFENIFLKEEIGDTYQGQVRLFGEKGVNLFEECIIEGGKFDNRNRIILYCLVSYAVKYDLKVATEDLRHYLRVIRNLLQATRQRHEIVYRTNVRINSFGKYWILFKQLSENSNVYERLLEEIDNKGTDISDEALSNEKEKARILVNNSFDPSITQALFRLEECRYFGGLIHNLNPADNVENLPSWAESVREIWACNDDAIIAALITCGFFGVYIKPCLSGEGELQFFGKKDNWNTILAGQNKTDKDLSDPMISLLNKYKAKKQTNRVLNPQEILETIIREFLDSIVVKNWKYYFCKYKEYFLIDTNYYAWYRKWGDDEFELEILSSTSINPLLANHTNPYVKAVSNLLNDTICQEHLCRERFSYESRLRLSNGIHLYSKQDGWTISIPEGQSIPDELRKKYNIDDKNTFKETGEKDRIEIAVAFCEELMKQVL
jgi:hypothetical protein